MSKIDYINYLKLLKLYNENYLLEKTMAKNTEIFQIKNEEIEINEKKKKYESLGMDLTKYLSIINANEFQEFNKSKVKLKILSYYKVLSLGIGSSFGDYALINENSMRTATIFVKEDSFFGTLSKQSYQNSIKSVNEKSNKLSLNFVFNTTIFDEITFPYFTIRYWNFFIKNRVKRDELLFEKKSQLEDIIFFYEGEVTLIIPHLTCKKIDELISKIGNTSIEYNQYNDVEKPKDIALKHIKKGDILGMNDIVIDNEFICNAVCKSEQAIYFSINIKIFNYILMAQIEFIYKSVYTNIPCSHNEKLTDIIGRYKNKINKNLNSVYYLYSGNIIQNIELTFDEIANSIDRNRNKMVIQVN
jgi:hypothetical protein